MERQLPKPVVEGTNLASVSSPNVDILAHPGLITLEEARIAAANGVFLEVSGRKGHGMANGHVVKTARAAGAKLVLDSDAHAPEDLLTRDYAMKVARGSGLDLEDAVALLDAAPLEVLDRIGVSRERIPGPERRVCEWATRSCPLRANRMCLVR